MGEERWGIGGGADGKVVLGAEGRNQLICRRQSEDGDTKYAAHGGACGSWVKGVGAAQGNHGGNPHGVGCAKECANISGIHHFIEDENLGLGVGGQFCNEGGEVGCRGNLSEGEDRSECSAF